MLRKTMKYEFAATSRIFLPMYAVLVLMSVIARIFYSARFNSASPAAIVSFLMVMLFTAVVIATFVMILNRFWTNLLGREGYLMHALPVKSYQHVLAKLLVMTVWCLCSAVACLLALLIMTSAIDGFWSTLHELPHMFSELMKTIRSYGSAAQFVLLAVQLVLLVFFSIFSSILQMYAAMSCGQLVNKHRVWTSVGSYIGIGFVFSVIGTLLPGAAISLAPQLILGYQYSLGQTLGQANIAVLLLLVIELVKTAALFIATTLILDKKLNLQ